MNKKVVFIPGNGGGSPKDNWFPSVKGELEAAGLTVTFIAFLSKRGHRLVL